LSKGASRGRKEARPGLFIEEIRLERPETAGENDAYPFSVPGVRHLTRLELERPVTFFAGENGMGKSTLIEAIAVKCGFNPEGGSKHFNFSTRATHSGLHDHIILGKGTAQPRDGYFLRAESFYNLATEIERVGNGSSPPAYGEKSPHEQSHGESFLALVLNRFFGCGLYLLDEPEAALSATSQLALLAGIHRLAQKGSQFIVATHSPILLAYPYAHIYVLEESRIALTPYEETDAYLITKHFLNQPENMLRRLLDQSL
jgi:predicted ATPase